jgi:hypothetical protein
MTSTTNSRDEIVAEIAAAITHANAAWASGRMTSPSQLDYVLDADRILAARLPSYPGSTREGREYLADELYEDAGETWVSAEDLAAHIYDVMTAV